MATGMRNLTLLSSSLGKSYFKTCLCSRTPGSSRYLHSGHIRKGLSYRQQSVLHRHEQKCLQILTARFASTGTPDIPVGYVPDIPLAPLDDVKNMLPELNAIGEPTLASMDLGGWGPVGLIQQCMEFMHVAGDVPWWTAIALTALTVRTCVFPMMVYSRKHGAHLRNHLPTISRLQQRISDEKMKDNQLEWRNKTNDLSQYMKRNDIKFRRIIVMPLIQAPIFISVYQAIRGMSNLPVESMKTGGTLWFTDLTVPDPYLALPAITAISILAMLEVGAESQKTSDMSHAMKWGMRAIPLIAFAFTYKFASGLALYWTINNFISLLTVQFLKISKVQKFFKIPTEVKQKKKKQEKKGFVEGFRDMYDNYKLEAEVDRRRRVDDIEFKKAGVGPIPKTFRENPTRKVPVNKKVRASA